MRDSEVPFQIRVSRNAEEFVFTDKWDHRRHYQAVFNSQFDVLPKHMPQEEPWAMLADWRHWLVQVPESERLCIRSVHNFVSSGMTHYALVSDGHPVAQWQASRVKDANSELKCQIFSDFSKARLWLEQEGFDTAFDDIAFNQEWLNPSARFDRVLVDLEVDESQFITTA